MVNANIADVDVLNRMAWQSGNTTAVVSAVPCAYIININASYATYGLNAVWFLATCSTLVATAYALCYEGISTVLAERPTTATMAQTDKDRRLSTRDRHSVHANILHHAAVHNL